MSLVLAAVTVYVVYALNRSAAGIEQTQQVEQTSQTLDAVADPLARLCATDPSVRARVGTACDTAAQAVSAPPKNGVDGRNGTDGMDGRDGINGKDGQSPPCLLTPAQCQGRDGIDGTDGVDGTNGVDGKDGRDGSPAAEMVVNRTDGTTLRCPRTGGEDTAPVYTCQAT